MSPLVAVQIIAMSLSVFMSVCPSVGSHVSKPTRLNFTKFLAHVTCGRGLIVFGRQKNMLCTSDFVDDVMFSCFVADVDVTTQRIMIWLYRLVFGNCLIVKFATVIETERRLRHVRSRSLYPFIPSVVLQLIPGFRVCQYQLLSKLYCLSRYTELRPKVAVVIVHRVNCPFVQFVVAF